jgi:hypothetical protein
MWMFVKAKEDKQLVRESNQLQAQNIHTILATMKVELYRAESVTTSN